jgi:nicotinamidase-related amidase
MASRTALLVIDVQVCNFDEANPVFGGKDLLSTVEMLIAAARSANVPVIFIQHCGPEGGVDQIGSQGGKSIHASLHMREISSFRSTIPTRSRGRPF